MKRLLLVLTCIVYPATQAHAEGDKGYIPADLSVCINNAKQGIVVSNKTQEYSDGVSRVIQSLTSRKSCYLRIRHDEQKPWLNFYLCDCSVIVFAPGESFNTQ